MRRPWFTSSKLNTRSGLHCKRAIWLNTTKTWVTDNRQAEMCRSQTWKGVLKFLIEIGSTHDQ